MAIITDQPEGLPSGNDLDNIEDPDAPEPGERAEIYLSGSHVCTLDDAPANRDRITMMVDLEVFEETTRANGDEDVPIRKCKRIGDMYLPGTTRPPSKEERKAAEVAEKVKAAREKAEQDEAERAEAEHNEPPMFDADGDPLPLPGADTPVDPDPPADDVVDGHDGEDGPAENTGGGNVVSFSDSSRS